MTAPGRTFSVLQAGTLVVLLVVLLPLAAVFWLGLTGEVETLAHLARTVLLSSITTTVLLMLGVAVLTLAIGTSTAWLVTMHRFPGRDLFDWLLIVPLAIPTYIIAYCYVEWLDYSGPVQEMLRSAGGWTSARDYWFPEVRSLGGAILVLSLVLYPYVYLSARASFLQQSVCILEAARTLGRTATETFWQVALPLAWPALAAGVALALMECLNDIGAVEYLGVQTMTVSVYTTWLERSSLGGAAQLATLLVMFVLGLFWIEQNLRGRRQFHHTTGRFRAMPPMPIHGGWRFAASAICGAPILLGSVIPVLVLVKGAMSNTQAVFETAFWWAALHSVALAVGAAGLAVSAALVVLAARRLEPGPLARWTARFARLGYAVPGTILAIGLLVPLAAFDNWVDGWMRSVFNVSTGLMLSGGVTILLLGYTVRFAAVSVGAIEAGYTRLSTNLDAAARTLGESGPGTFRTIHLPLLRPAIAMAGLLVFVDTMKELSATLLLRPFNFSTLATRVYDFAALDEFEEATLAALVIVLVGLAPVLMLHRAIVRGRAGGAHE